MSAIQITLFLREVCTDQRQKLLNSWNNYRYGCRRPILDALRPLYETIAVVQSGTPSGPSPGGADDRRLLLTENPRRFTQEVPVIQYILD